VPLRTLRSAATLRSAVASAIALALTALAVPPAQADSALPAPVAAGNSAGNMQLSGASKWVLTRWVARSTGTLAALHLRIQADGSVCRLDGKTGYGAGTGGTWHVTTHPVLPDGRPDMSQTLATQDFRPCFAAPPLVDVRQGIVRLPMNIPVTRGHEYATVVRNTDPAPAVNFTSINFLYTATGILGANGRNERSGDAPDAYYGLDPRELVGYSSDGGGTWALPGGQYGHNDGGAFLPTYIQEYAGGLFAGQPFYYASSASTSTTMAFRNIRHPWTISALGAYTPSPGSGTLTLTVDGTVRASAGVTGPGMVRAPITPVTVQPGQLVEVSATGIAIKRVVADTAWGRLMGMQLASSPWYIEGGTNFSAAAPVYALPAYAPSATLSAATRSKHGARNRHHRKHRHKRRHHHQRRHRHHHRKRHHRGHTAPA